MPPNYIIGKWRRNTRKITWKLEKVFIQKVKVVSNSLRPHGILQARILEGVGIPFSRGSFQPRDRTQVSRITGGFFTIWAPGEPKNTGVGSWSLLQRSSQPRNWTGVSGIAGRFYTSWATKEAHLYTGVCLHILIKFSWRWNHRKPWVAIL